MGGRGGSSRKRGGGGGGLTQEEQEVYDNLYKQPDLVINGQKKYVPDWFHNRELSGASVGKIERETEKAVLVSTKRDMGSYDARGRNVWIPKSILQTKKEYAKSIVESNKRASRSREYGDYLRKTAKDNGVKIGNMSSWEKIADKLRKNGVKVKSRKEFG